MPTSTTGVWYPASPPHGARPPVAPSAMIAFCWHGRAQTSKKPKSEPFSLSAAKQRPHRQKITKSCFLDCLLLRIVFHTIFQATDPRFHLYLQGVRGGHDVFAKSAREQRASENQPKSSKTRTRKIIEFSSHNEAKVKKRTQIYAEQSTVSVTRRPY